MMRWKAGLALAWLGVGVCHGSSIVGGQEPGWAEAPEIQRRYQGWFVWQCWDEAQRVVVEISSARSDAEGKVVAEGIEHYEVGRGSRSVPVRLVLDRGTGGFQLWEIDEARDSDALLTSRGPYGGRIARSGERVGLSAARERDGCEPKVLLEADAGEGLVVAAGE